MVEKFKIPFDVIVIEHICGQNSIVILKAIGVIGINTFIYCNRAGCFNVHVGQILKQGEYI